MSYIKVKKVTKVIKKILILDDISMELEKGKIYGFFGRNASGKTMFFRALCGLIKLSDGEILIDDKVLGVDIDFPPSCGVIIENPGFWDELTGFENLKNLATIKGVIDDQSIYKAIGRVGLDCKDNRPIRKYSLGMKQKLAIAQAIMEAPELIILDEPTNALDDESVINIRNILKEEKNRGATILIASHNKDDIDQLSDIKFNVNKGKIFEVGVKNET